MNFQVLPNVFSLQTSALIINFARGLGFFFCSFVIFPTVAKSQMSDSIYVKKIDSFVLNRDNPDSSKRTFLNELEEEIKTNLSEYSQSYSYWLFQYGWLYRNKNFIEAEKKYIKSYEIGKKVFKVEDKNYVKIVYNLGLFYANENIKNYTKSDSFYNEVVLITKNSPDIDLKSRYVRAVYGLASNAFETKRYDEAKSWIAELDSVSDLKTLNEETYINLLYLRAKYYIYEEQFDKAELSLNLIDKIDKDSTRWLVDYGAVYDKKGRYQKSKDCFVRASDIAKKNNCQYCGQCYNALGAVYYRLKEYDKSIDYYKKAKDYWTGSDTTPILYNTGISYKDKRDFATAEPLLIEANDIAQWQNWDYVYGLANLYHRMGQYNVADSLYNILYTKEIGISPTTYIGILIEKAVLLGSVNKIKDCTELMKDGQQKRRKRLNNYIKYSTEGEIADYFTKFKDEIDFCFSVSQDKKINLSGEHYNNLLFYKALLLENQLALKQAAAKDTSIFRIRQEGIALKQEVNKIEGSENLQSRIDSLDKLVAQKTGISNKEVSWKDVQAKLKKGEIAIEFVAYKNYKNLIYTDNTYYAALVLLPTDTMPHFVPLFDATKLKAFEKPTEKATITAYYNPPTADKESLYDLMWKPLEHLLTGVKTIYYAPDGELHRINLSALALKGNVRLCDKFKMVRMGSTKELVFKDKIDEFTNQTAVLYGGINYEMDSAAITQSNGEFGVISADFIDKYTLQDGNVNKWSSLEGTQKETNTIKDFLTTAGFQCRNLNGYDATEESIKYFGEKSPSPMVLHIASHGFYIKDILGTKILEQGSDEFLERTGLVFAGANHVWLGGASIKGLEDGILTAYEVSLLDFSNTQLVVLSACETGLGNIVSNEGVYGLQRAFKIAGAQHIIVSLWKQSDKYAQEFMSDFYRNWQENKNDLQTAFENTQKNMKSKHDDPFAWAGFVLF